MRRRRDEIVPELRERASQQTRQDKPRGGARIAVREELGHPQPLPGRGGEFIAAIHS